MSEIDMLRRVAAAAETILESNMEKTEEDEDWGWLDYCLTKLKETPHDPD